MRAAHLVRWTHLQRSGRCPRQTAAASEGWDPARCVVVEDSPFGVQAAKSAGMAVIGFARVTPAERLSAADVVIRDMANVVEALNSLML